MRLVAVLLTGILLAAGLGAAASPEWGFFGHRRLNRLAVFTLDQDMMPFFRAHLEYLTDHAVDPDKRRYATKHEAVRHYIDLDHWDLADVPRDWTDALIWQAEFQLINGTDTTLLDVHPDTVQRAFFHNNVLPHFYADAIVVPPDSLRQLGIDLPPSAHVEVAERFSEHGILPYHLLRMHRRITQAFVAEDADRLLRLCAEMGHYIGDAHVPLHTTENYNGQLTGQTGIHAFWESRIPELFADDNFDYLVGKARYIDDPAAYYWGIVLDSHALVDSVLSSERRLRETFPVDRQLVFDERLGKTIKTQSPEFAAAWSAEMQGMVEERFRAAILSIGSVWYSCWVDAGQPELDYLVPSDRLFLPSDTVASPVPFSGRPHE